MIEILIPVLVVIVLLAGNRLKAKGKDELRQGTLTPRMQRMIEKMQAQQGFQPPTPQGQYTQPAGGHGSPGHAGTVVQSSAQMAGQHNTQYHGPAPYAGAPTQAMPFAQPGQFQPPQFQPPQIQQTPFQQGQFQSPAIWNPPAPQRAAHPKQSQRDLDSRVREMMKAGNEVGAVRLLCDEQDLGIIDAQKRARSLAAPANGNGGNGGSSEREREGASSSSSSSGVPEQETRYVGSAAFADSLFDTNRDDQETWASGWKEVPEAEDRSDMDELWKTVRDHGRPGPG